MLRFAIYIQILLVGFPLQAKIDAQAQACLAPFVARNPEEVFNERAFPLDKFKRCSRKLLFKWDQDPQTIQDIPFRTAVQGLRAILSLTRLETEEGEISRPFQGRNLHARMQVLLFWIQKQAFQMEQKYNSLLADSKEWGEEEKEFFSLSNSLLLGTALLKGIPISLFQLTVPTQEPLQLEQFKILHELAEKVDEIIRIQIATLAKKYIALFPVERQKIEAALASMESPYHPAGGLYMITGGIFQDALSSFQELPTPLDMRYGQPSESPSSHEGLPPVDLDKTLPPSDSR